jgi:NAD(P)-dependent dehydrogenase (short-subunit alcohol dehydrogenase family)
MGQRTAIVTGASRGLGLALTEGLVASGWRVVVDARHGDELAAATAHLGDAVLAVPGDLTDATHRRTLARRSGPDLALVVNNAGGLGPSPLPPLTDYPLDALRDLFDANVVAPLALVQETAATLAANRGTVLDVTSDASVEAYEGWGGYGATKAALDHLGAVLAVERPELRVLTVDPGDMRTRMHQDAFPGEDISDRPPPEASVPGILALVEDGGRPSGRYRAREVVPT